MLISPVISLAALLVGAAFLLLTRPLVRRSRALGKQLTATNRKVHATVTDFLAGLKIAKSYNVEGSHVQRFADAITDARRRTLAFTAASSAARTAFHLGAAATLAALIWFSVQSAALTVPELLVMVLIFARVLPGLSSLQRDTQQLVHVLPAYAHPSATDEAFRAAVEDLPGAEGTPPTLGTKLTVRDVSFSYHGCEGEPALTGIDFTIPARQITVLAGPSGAGKSTVPDLLLGLVEPCRGALLVDGSPLAGSCLRRWRRTAAYVPQDPYLFHETIRANLLWACPRASEADIWRSLDRAAASGFVKALPHGLDTVVGDHGARLSGGERQRIALARALITEPTLLVLDEVTSQLDSETERQVLAAIESLRGRTTVVAITHRPALLRDADQIVLLESGRVVATDTWSALAPRFTAEEDVP